MNARDASSRMAAPAAGQHASAPSPPSADQLYARHGAALHTLASVLTGDSACADTLVVDAITISANGHATTSGTLRELAATVCAAWASRSASAARTVTAPPPLEPLHQLPDDQRMALALCVFGDHLYTQAADFLGLPAEQVARLLREALRTLSQTDESPAS